MAFEPKKINEDEIIDEEQVDFGSQGGISIKDIIFNHIDRISRMLFKNQTGVSFNEGGKGSMNIEDTRPMFIQAVNFLHQIVEPYYDKEMNKKRDEIFEKIPEIEKQVLIAGIDKEAYNRAVNASGNFNINFQEWRNYLFKIGYKGYYKDTPEYEFYIDTLYYIYSELFGAIQHLLYRKDYLASEVYGE